MRKQRIVIVETCDRCPLDDSKEVTGTYPVSYGTARYELDLCADHKTELDEIMAGIVSRARKPVRPARTRSADTDSAEYARQARAWAIKTGREINRMGHVPKSIISEYTQWLNNQSR